MIPSLIVKLLLVHKPAVWLERDWFRAQAEPETVKVKAINNIHFLL